MSNKTGLLFRKFIFICWCLCSLLFLLVCLVPFLDPGDFWLIAMLGLGFPLLLALMVLSLLVWSVKRSWFALVTLLILLCGWQQVRASIGFHFFREENLTEKPAGTIRLFFWNVARWDEHNRYNKGGVSFRELMLEEVAGQQADILCLQEFFEPYHSQYFLSNLKPLEKMGFKHHYFFPSSVMRDGELKIGLIILSRFPIVDSGSLSFGQTPHSEGICYADINTGSKVLRVMSTHLESSRMDNNTYLGSGDNGPGAVSKATGMARKLKHAYAYRAGQARLVADMVKRSPHPLIVCGNLGDVPNSYSYFKVKDGLRDAFVENGAGFGRTFRFISPTLRLDCIFHSESVSVENFGRPSLEYSDHLPLVADFIIK